MARENPESAFAHIETKLEEGEGSITSLRSSTYPWIADTGVCNRVRWTSAQSKRVATNNDRTRSMVSHEHPKKRAALTNLTNQSLLVSTTTMIDVLGIKGSKGYSNNEMKQNSVVETSLGKSVQSQSQDENLCCRDDKLNVSDSCDDLKSIVDDANLVAIGALELEPKTNLYILDGSSTFSQQEQKLVENGSFGNSEIKKGRFNNSDIANERNMSMDLGKDGSFSATSIYQFLRFSEMKLRPRVDYMKANQPHINANMRGILVDWLVEVAEEYKLVPDSLYLTVAYLDRYLSVCSPVKKHQLQLVGVACMIVASKYEEICPPQLEEFCYITDNTYNIDEVLNMEKQVLHHLGSNLGGPTPKTFLRRFIRTVQASKKSSTLLMEFLGNYMAELTLQDYECLKYPPSMIAGSAIFVAKFILEPSINPWNEMLHQCTGYNASELKECVQVIHSLQHNVKHSTLHAIHEKYRHPKFKCVADIVSPEVIPSEFFKD